MEILMDLDKLKKELIADEGQKLNENGEHIIYLDHLGYKTFVNCSTTAFLSLLGSFKKP